MLIAVNEGEQGSYSRYLIIKTLDAENLSRAKEIFLHYQQKDIMKNRSFDDPVWEMNDEKQTVKIRFDISETGYHVGAKKWIGCSHSCFVETAKAYITFQFGMLTVCTLREIAATFKKVAGMDARQVMKLRKNIRHVVELLQLFPEQFPFRETVVKSLEEAIADGGLPFKTGKRRRLADFRSYFRFHEVLETYWGSSGSNEKLFFFPIYLWWSLTAILPLRPTEFLLIPRECLEDIEGETWLTVRRTRLKGGMERIGYRIEQDYEKKQYKVPEKMAEGIRWYHELTADMHPAEVDALFRNEAHYSTRLLKGNYRGGYYTYENLRECLQIFYREVLNGKEEVTQIQLGDTRHIAMMNLIISGGSPVICRELAGHADIDISSHYYANMARLVECTTYEMYRKVRKGAPVSLNGRQEYDIRPTADFVRLVDGWCSSSAFKKQETSDCIKNINHLAQIGECHSCRYYRPDVQGMHLDFLDEKRGEASVKADSWYLMYTVELVRRGLGYEEEIKQALLRLQHSCDHYKECLWEKYRKDEK